MFKPETYIQRRKLLKKEVGSGLLLFPGNGESPMNYTDNTYHFRQDSSFLYFFGLDSPGLAAIVDIDENKDVLFGDDIGIEDIIWMGNLPKMKDRALEVGVRHTAPRAAFGEAVRKARAAGRPVHFLPPYRADNALVLSGLLGIPVKKIKAKASLELIKAVVDQRLYKSKEEVREIETAVEISRAMFLAAMKLAKPGRYEHEISGAMEGIALSRGGRLAFPPIVTINGQTLHNHFHGNVLVKGRLLVMDVGAEAASSYASDITRTVPVGGRFNRRQKDVYEIVLSGQETGIRAMKPGVMFKEIHLKTARVMASGLKDIGLMKGNIEAAVAAGAHALFFPHGLGHNMGLDVHDMENLGENNIGYDKTVERSGQFGLAYLRMAKVLRPGHVMTVEPGLYFIPALVEKWRKEKKFRDFIAYDEVEKYLDFGGARIEDNVLITEKGHRVLGPLIPKTVADIEKACRA
ncbi:MAG TPA: aminopeptidase P family protein [Candidatus Latescibacteria bacterium]|nr:aminopeptidase P family protein [Candidatus Latescibacterota bacterium]